MVNEFHETFSILETWFRSMISQISDFDPQKLQKVDSKTRPHWEFENAVGALRHLIFSQGLILSERTGGFAHFTSMMMADKLETAFNEVWAVCRSLRMIFDGLASAAKQNAEVMR